MPHLSEMYFKAASIFLVVGIAMGLQMSISGEHNVTGAHAHLSLLGWVSAALFGIYFALVPAKAGSRLALVQFWIIVLSTAAMTGALYLVLLGVTALAPLIAAGSLAYFAGCLIFLWIVFAHAEAPHVARQGRMPR